MPYKSKKQMAWAHSDEGMKALGKKKVSEYDKESKGKKLPTRVKKSNALKTAIMKK